MKISVLTPTYNRAKLLKRLYQSLLENKNTSTVTIEWLIMDDGSTDETKQVVENWIKEKRIEIQYFSQKNQGKMVAINHLVAKAKGELIVECDSDDYFTQDAFKKMKEEWEKNRERKDIYGICFLKNDTKGHTIGNALKNETTTMFDLYFKEGETGDKAIVFFSEIRKKYKYELEKQENFVTEARMFHKMDEAYQIVCKNEPIMICEYQEDGYTNNIQKQFMENPYGYYEYFKETLQKDFKGVKFSKRLYAIKHLILFSYLTKQYQTKSIKNWENKVLYYILLIPGVVKSIYFVK